MRLFQASLYQRSPSTNATVPLAHLATTRTLTPTPFPPYTLHRVTRQAQQTPQIICTREGDIAETKLISQWAAAGVAFANRGSVEDFFAYGTSSRR